MKHIQNCKVKIKYTSSLHYNTLRFQNKLHQTHKYIKWLTYIIMPCIMDFLKKIWNDVWNSPNIIDRSRVIISCARIWKKWQILEVYVLRIFFSCAHIKGSLCIMAFHNKIVSQEWTTCTFMDRGWEYINIYHCIQMVSHALL